MVTLKEMKSKVLSMIEEVNPNSKNLTDDPDIAAKFNYVTNQIIPRCQSAFESAQKHICRRWRKYRIPP